MGELITIRDMYKVYNPGENEVRALDGVDLSIDESEFVAIIGQSGSDCAITVHVLFRNENWDCQLTEDDTVTMAQVVDCIESNYDLILNMTIMFYDKD